MDGLWFLIIIAILFPKSVVGYWLAEVRRGYDKAHARSSAPSKAKEG